MTEKSHDRALVSGASLKEIVLACALCVGSINWAMAANHSVSAQTSSFDCSAVRPGDTVTLASGVRGPLKIRNCMGTSSAPIVIRNDPAGTGPTVIQRTTGDAGGFVFDCGDCIGVQIDGSAKWVGAPTRTTYGIKITMTGGGSPGAFLRIGGLSRFVTIRNVEIDGAWPKISTDGIGIFVNDHGVTATDNPGVWREGFLIENNYVRNIEGEGMYIGPNWRNDDVRLRNIEIRANLVEDTGWDGIQLKSAIAGTNLIHHNVVRRAGKKVDAGEGQHYGISIYEGTGRIYNNWIEDSGEMGISHYIHWMPKAYGDQVCEIFNNVVVDSGKTGPLIGHSIVSANQSGYARPVPRVYNNTIIRGEGSGIRIGPEAAGGFVRDNIIADAGATPIIAPSSVTMANNRVGSVLEMAFEEAASRNFRLKSSSPARNSGGKEFPSVDFDDVARPQDGVADQGAFEHRADVPRPAPPVLDVQ